MTRNTCHIGIPMRQLIAVPRHITPGRIVLSNRLCILRLLVEVAASRSHRIECLRHAPPTSRDNHGVLNNVPALQLDIVSLFILALSITCDFLEERDACTSFVANADTRQILTTQGLVLRLAPFGRRSGNGCCSKTGSKQVRTLPNRTVTIFTIDFYGGTWLVVQNSITV